MLLVLHGFTGSDTGLVTFFQGVTNEYQLIIPYLIGHGRSTNLNGVFTHKQVVLDIIELLNQVGVTQCDALGFSAGADILLHMARQQPELVSGMTLISRTTHFSDLASSIMKQFTERNKTEAGGLL